MPLLGTEFYEYLSSFVYCIDCTIHETDAKRQCESFVEITIHFLVFKRFKVKVKQSSNEHEHTI